MTLILASTSATRRAMLRQAGVPHEAMAPGVDEDEVRLALRAEGVVAPGAIAHALAQHKALRISRRFPEQLVLGGDQVLSLADGTMLDKPADMAAAEAQLRRLRGSTHQLTSAAATALGGEIVWHARDTASLTMRDFSDAFLERYLAVSGEVLIETVGGYRIEGLGAQLFARVEGDHFTIQGLPLLAVLDHLRGRRILAA